MSHATKPLKGRSIPQDPNTGPLGRGTTGRTPGKGKFPVAGYGSDKMEGGVPGAFGDTRRQQGAPKGDEVTEETGHSPGEGLLDANSSSRP